jgi:hypothetical protein
MKPEKPTPTPAPTLALTSTTPTRIDRRLAVRTGLRAGPYSYL